MTHNLTYHPLWEPAFDYGDKNKFANQLQAIANKKEDEYLMVEDSTVKVIGRIVVLWQSIKGWLGFQNLADPVKVNYQILKMLRYGEEIHHYLDKDSIKLLLRQVRDTLSTQPQHADIAAFIQRTFLAGSADSSQEQICTILDREISVYYDRNSQSLLKEGIWSKYFPALRDNTAVVEYNMGRIKAAEGRLEESIPKFNEAAEKIENALAHAPNKSEWQLFLAKLYLELANLQFSKSNYASSDRSCALCIAHLIKITKVEDEDFNKDIRDLLKQSLVFQFSTAIKESNEPKALEILTKARGAFNISAAEFLDEYYNHVIITHPEAFIGYKELGDLFYSIAKAEKDPVSSTQILSKATDHYEQAYRDASQGADDIQQLQESLKSLFKLHEEVSRRYLEEKQWVDAQVSLTKALSHFENYKAAAEKVDFHPPVKEIIELAEHFKQEQSHLRALACYEMAISPTCRGVAETLPGGESLENEVSSCYTALGEEGLSAKNYESAFENFEYARKMKNISPEITGRIADGFVSLGDFLIHSRNELEKDIAFRSYNSALPLMQQNKERAEKLVTTLIKMADASKDKNNNDAIGFLEVARQNAPQHLEIYGKLAACYKTEGNWKKAEECLRAYLEKVPEASVEPQHLIIEETYKDIAQLCQKQSHYLEAAETLRLAADIGASDKNYEVDIFQNLLAHVDQLCEGKQYREALAICEKMIQNHPLDCVQTATALLHLAELMEVANDLVSSIRAYEAAAPFLDKLFYNEPAKQQHILYKIARDAHERGNWGKAIKFYQDLLHFNTRDLKIILPLVDSLIAHADYSTAQSLIEKSLLSHVDNVDLIYRSALLYKAMGLKEAYISKLNQVVLRAPSRRDYLQELIQIETETANNYLKIGISNPDKINEETSGLVSGISPPQTAIYSQFMFITEDIQKALAPSPSKTQSTFRQVLRLFGYKSDFEKLVACRNKPRSIGQVKFNSLKALSLIQKAYDGQPNHKEQGEIPPELSYRVQKLQGMVDGIDQYYGDLQIAGKKMAEMLQNIGVSNTYDWKNIVLLEDLSNAHQIQKQAQKILLQFDTLPSNIELSSLIKEQSEFLRAMLSHKKSLQLAITHYINIYQKAPDQYGDYCNKLVEALVANDQYEEAIKWFDIFYDKFPENQNSLYIDSKAYAAVFIALRLSKEKFSEKDIDQMSKAAERFPNDQSLQGLPFFLFKA